MKEAKANLWTYPADLRVVTTNGFVKSNGEAVMGRGCAQELAQAAPHIPKKLGSLIRRYGNRPFRITNVNGADVVTLPVKHHWREEADPHLIHISVLKLITLVNKFGYHNVVMPRPGCGNGRLEWPLIRNTLQALLDDRFTVVTYP